MVSLLMHRKLFVLNMGNLLRLTEHVILGGNVISWHTGVRHLGNFLNVVDRPLNEWMTDGILTLKTIRRKSELIWRKTRTTINFDIYYDSSKAVKEAISKRKSELME